MAAEFALRAIGAALDRLLEPESLARIHAAATLIAETDSRVIVTGMGKCWHIARKIAATLQSTGQPASALHPGEALHGDMGAIAPGDMLMALSNSGETDEVLAVAHYALERGCPLLLLTGKATSPLALIATAVVLVPDGPEGCPLGRAPMASAAAMMAIGDAVAAELMVRRGFAEADFLALHHGGYLGRQMRAVA